MMESLIVFAERESDIGFNRFVGRAFQGLAHVPARPESIPLRVPRVCEEEFPAARGRPPPAGILCPMISPRFLKLVDLFPLCPILTPELLPAPFQIASRPEPV